MVLRAGHRTAAGAARAREAAAALGFQPVSTGRATLSATISPGAFASLFGVEAKPVAAKRSGKFDFGAPAGYACEETLRVPDDLAAYVEVISVTPPATRL
ncbi:MAG: hypothetical protein ACRD96_09600 [Bryobacteraceae bacterium]